MNHNIRPNSNPFSPVLNLAGLNAEELFGSRPKRQATYDISDKVEYQDANGRDYMLAASSDIVLKKKRNNQLVCSEPGFFADVSNLCQVYHVCVETGRPDQSGFDLRQYSFFCGAGTIFDQVGLISFLLPPKTAYSVVVCQTSCINFRLFHTVQVNLRGAREGDTLPICTVLLRDQQANGGRQERGVHSRRRRQADSSPLLRTGKPTVQTIEIESNRSG